MMKRIVVLAAVCAIAAASSYAQTGGSVKLNPPDTTRGFSVMKALSLRASASEFDTTRIRLQDLSDLLWASNGINRARQGKRTAPSAINAQDVDVYLCTHEGIFRYDAKSHSLESVVEGDYRNLAAGRQANAAKAPAFCLLISDIARFSSGGDSLRMVWAAEDAGIVSQNISLFCASVGMATRVRATMDLNKLREVMKLKSTQHLLLNHPISYIRE